MRSRHWAGIQPTTRRGLRMIIVANRHAHEDVVGYVETRKHPKALDRRPHDQQTVQIHRSTVPRRPVTAQKTEDIALISVLPSSSPSSPAAAASTAARKVRGTLDR